MDDNIYKYNKFRSTCAQVSATLAFECLIMNVGIIAGMTVIVIGALRSPGSDITFTEDQASWFAGLLLVVQPVGSLVSGFLQDILGRKMCMLLVNIPQFASWILLYYATSVSTLFIAITVMGLSLGFMETAVLSYIGEICEPRLRGFLSTFGGIFLNVGFIISALIGAMTDWRTMMLISAVFPAMAFLAVAVVPDSPAWLVTKGRVEDARKAYQWLRGWTAPEAVREELDALVAYVKQSRKLELRIVNSLEYRAVSTANADGLNSTIMKERPESKLKMFLHPSVQRPFRLIVLYFFVASCANLTAMRPFLIEFLTGLNLPIRPQLVIFFGTVLVLLGSVTSTLAMRRLGKRGLTLCSFGLGVPCCLGLGLYLGLELHMPWMALILICLSNYSIALSMLTVPWILISEVFPLKVRGLASGVAAAFGYVLMFIVIKTYFNIISLVGVSGACLFYGVVGLLGMVYLYYHLPETEGIPLEEIEKFFYNDNIKDNSKKKPSMTYQQNLTDSERTEKNLPA